MHGKLSQHVPLPRKKVKPSLSVFLSVEDIGLDPVDIVRVEDIVTQGLIQ
jgi:hypothetical protein